MKTILCTFLKGKVITRADNTVHCEHQEYKFVVTWLIDSCLLRSSNILTTTIIKNYVTDPCFLYVLSAGLEVVAYSMCDRCHT